MRNTKAYSRLRRDAAAGDAAAIERLRARTSHLLASGWNLTTISRRMGMHTATLAVLVQPSRLVLRKEEKQRNTVTVSSD